jgi:hypothetical protein
MRIFPTLDPGGKNSDPGFGIKHSESATLVRSEKKRTLWWIVIFLVWEREGATTAAVGLVGVTLGAVFLELRPRGQLLLAQVAREPDLPAPIICRYYKQCYGSESGSCF